MAKPSKKAAGRPITPPNPERLLQLTWGYAPLLIVEAAISHGVFHVLKDSALTLEDVAARTGASQRGLRAILNALVGLELLRKEGAAYALSPESAAFLVPGKLEYYGGLFHHHVRHVLPAWMQLREVVESGCPAVKPEGQATDQERFARFVEALFVSSYEPAQNVGRHLGVPNWDSPATVLDLGAGSGVWGIALAEQSPHVRVRAVDFPMVLEVTKRVAGRHGVAERLETVPGDLLEADFGSGHRVATIGQVLHSEGAERNRRLLKKTHEALAPGGTVVISEFIPNDERTGPPRALIFAVNMLVHNAAGDTFTVPEISEWLREAGFENLRLFDASAASPLILADKPKS